METFYEMYFDGNVDFNGDALDIMEYRHDWANFRFTVRLFWFFLTGMIPEVIMHTRSQGIQVSCSCSTCIIGGRANDIITAQTKNKSVTTMTAATTFTAGSSGPV